MIKLLLIPSFALIPLHTYEVAKIRDALISVLYFIPNFCQNWWNTILVVTLDIFMSIMYICTSWYQFTSVIKLVMFNIRTALKVQFDELKQFHGQASRLVMFIALCSYQVFTRYEGEG